eukprot:GHUV01045361.1.p1 GENE.GHUV01045361.1~~GHUV01045361.1.p1  ORF type:complete len:168 (-),score=41.67 GHUV01045361.1:170-673(-)
MATTGVTPSLLSSRMTNIIVSDMSHPPTAATATAAVIANTAITAEVFPTDVRTTFQGISAAAGKVGAIIADVVFGYVDQRTTFILSAMFGLVGAFVSWLFLPDTTGMSLDELDRWVARLELNPVCSVLRTIYSGVGITTRQGSQKNELNTQYPLALEPSTIHLLSWH